MGSARNCPYSTTRCLPPQLVHQPVPAPLPLQAALPLAPAPVHFAQAPLTLAQAPLPFAPAPLPLAQAPLPIAQAPLPLAPAPLPLAPAPLPLAAAPLPFGPAPVAALPPNPSSQFHAQDEFGQFSFGHQDINSAKVESRDAFGNVRGSYQYVDANGILQTVNYIADPVNGFRVAGTNIPVAPAAPNVALPVAPEVPVAASLIAPVPVLETPEVAKARAEHLAAHAEAKAAVAVVSEEARKKREAENAGYGKREAEPIDAGYGIPQALPLTLPVPLVHNAPAPILNHFVHPAPVAPTPIAPVPAFDARNFVPVNQVFQPNQFSFIPAPAPEAFPLSQIPAPLNLAPAPVAQIPAPFPVASAPVPLPLAQGPAPLTLAPAPLAIAPAPIPAAIPSTPSSQFHAQDEFGQFSFGYENINSAKTETKDAFGVTRGSYQYVAANGILQTVNYIADDVNGFRVAGTNIPTAPAALPASLPVGPAPVAETPEVAAARAAHQAAHDEALAAAAEVAADATEERKRRSPEEESEPTPDPEPEPEPEAEAESDRKKREAEPIDGDYEVPAAPVLLSAPVAVAAPVHLPQPAPLVHHASLHQ